MTTTEHTVLAEAGNSRIASDDYETNSETTETTEKSKVCRGRGWCFTLNIMKEHVEVDELITVLNVSGADTWAFQLEKGATGNLHYQGQLYFTNDRTWNCVRSLGIGRISLMKNCRASIKYTTTPDSTFIAGPWSKGIPVRFRDTRNDPFVLRPFQKELYEMKQSDRQITWVFDPKGNMGKTTFAKWWCKRHSDVLFVNGASKDIKCAVAQQVAKGKDPKVVIFGYPRGKEAFVSYEAIEEVKDGIFFNAKYESGMVVMDSPKVIVLANFFPRLKELTEDRWDIRTISEEYNLEDWAW